MFSNLNNDTIALIGLIIIAVGGIVVGMDSVTNVSVGAIGGFIGAESLYLKKKGGEVE